MNMLNKIKNVLGIKGKEDGISAKDEDQATARGEAYVKVMDVKFDPTKPSDGYFELEWNKIFVEQLQEAGYSGTNEDEIVDAWFTGLCRNIAEDES